MPRTLGALGICLLIVTATDARIIAVTSADRATSANPIQDAIDATSDGDTIKVQVDVYPAGERHSRRQRARRVLLRGGGGPGRPHGGCPPGAALFL